MKMRYLLGAAAVLVLAGIWLLMPANTDPSPGERQDPPAQTGPTGTGGAAESGPVKPPGPTPTEPPATGTPTPEGPPTGALAARKQEKVARGFAAAFTAKGDQEAWVAGLRRYATGRLMEQLELTAQWRRPTGKVLRVEIADAEVLRPQFTAEYVGGLVLVGELAPHRSGWLVDTIGPADGPPEPSAAGAG
jgi:hypothetical protein